MATKNAVFMRLLAFRKRLNTSMTAKEIMNVLSGEEEEEEDEEE